MNCVVCRNRIGNEYTCLECRGNVLNMMKSKKRKMLRSGGRMKEKLKELMEKHQFNPQSKVQVEKDRKERREKIQFLREQLESTNALLQKINDENKKKEEECKMRERKLEEANGMLAEVTERINHCGSYHFSSTHEKEVEYLRDNLQKVRRGFLFDLKNILPLQVKKNRLCVFSSELSIPIYAKINHLIDYCQQNPTDVSQVNSSIGYLSFLIKLIAWYLNIHLVHDCVYKGELSHVVDATGASFPLYYTSEKESNAFQQGLKLFSHNVLTICNHCGMYISPENQESAVANLIEFLQLPTLGKLGPFTYYLGKSESLSVIKPPTPTSKVQKFNYYIDNGFVKYLNLSFQKLSFNVNEDELRNEDLDLSSSLHFKKIWPKGYLIKYPNFDFEENFLAQ